MTALCAYQQSNYFVFDLVDEDTSKPIMGRLAVPSQTINTESVELSRVLPEAESEFEIEIDRTMQTTTDSSFDLIILEEETAQSDDFSFSSETFDLGTSTTVFGE